MTEYDDDRETRTVQFKITSDVVRGHSIVAVVVVTGQLDDEGVLDRYDYGAELKPVGIADNNLRIAKILHEMATEVELIHLAGGGEYPDEDSGDGES